MRLDILKENVQVQSFPELNNLKIAHGFNIKNSWPIHVHHTLKIGYIKKGGRILFKNGKWDIVKEGQIFIINPDEPHCYQNDFQSGHDFVILTIDKRLLMNVSSSYSEKNLSFMPHFHKTVIKNKKISSQMILVQEVLEQSPSILEKQSQLYSFLSDLISKYSLSSKQNDHKHYQAIYQVLQYLQENYHKNLNLEELAQLANLSPFYFHKLFQQYIGVSPHDYVIQTRIKKASDLLLKEMTISETAIETGFSDQSHFTKFFKKIIGITPGQYLQSRKISYIKNDGR